MASFSTLSDKAILRYIEDGEVVIDPFNLKNLNTSSYDVTLGPWYFREQTPKDEWISNVYNMYDEEHVKRVWNSPERAKPYSYYKEQGIHLNNIGDDDMVIFIGPGESILGHTNEFIGGVSHVTTMMKARSSLGRNFIETCSCAGWGDIGYFNRWTMEIRNNSTKYKIPLVVGRRIAQIVFLDTEGIINRNYNSDGKYQTKGVLEELQRSWSPWDMLPKMYKDREIIRNEDREIIRN